MPSGINPDQFINGCDDWLDGWFGHSWKLCCDAHDIAYTKGGDLVQKILADVDLGVCVFKISPVNGILMFIGVSIFGGLFYRFNGLNGDNLSDRIARWFTTLTSKKSDNSSAVN